jgi:glycosyltransferase involved in cell wall biosynthesis
MMSARKIAFITMVPNVTSGAAFSSQSVANVLQKEFPDFEIQHIDVIALLKNRKDLLLLNLFPLIEEYGQDILLKKKRARRCFLVTSYMFKQIKKLLLDVVSPDEHLFSFQMQSLFDASQPNLPHFVYTDHTVLANLYYPDVDRREVLYSPKWIELERTIYQNARVVFTRSTNITKSVVEQYGIPGEKVICVYAGSNVDVRDITSYNKDYRNKHILFVGSEWQRKGGDDLVEAFKAILHKHPDAHLTIVGSSPELDLPNCEVVGRVPLKEMKKYYEQASIFCLPTKLEPFGIAFLEAISYQLPVVSTHIGAVPDFVIHGKNGYLVQPGNVPELAQALLNLIDDPDKCSAFGRRGLELVKDRYSWEKVGSKMKEIIQANISTPEIQRNV